MVVALWLIVLLLFGVGGYFVFGTKQTQLDVNTPEGKAGACSEAVTTLTFPVKSFYQKSSSVSGATPYGRINGGGLTNLSTITSFGIGAKITDVYYSASNYIDDKQDEFEVLCGMTVAPTVELKAADNPSTFLVKDDSGNTLTDATTNAAVNASSTTGTLELELRIGSSADETTGDLIVVVEYDNDTQAREISISGATKLTGYPDIYSEEASNSLIRAFEIPAIEDGETQSFTVKVEPETGQTLGGAASAVRFTRFSKQYFEDVDGSLQYGIADSDNSAKFEDTGDYDVAID